MADVLDHREVVRDEQVRELNSLLQVHQQIDDLRLHRHVERRHRLVADDQSRPQRERARDAQALPLAAREFVRIARHADRPQADAVEQSDGTRVADVAAEAVSKLRIGSPTMSAARMRGLSDEYGILEDRLQFAPHTAASCRATSRSMRSPRHAIAPLVGSTSPGRALPVVDLAAAAFADQSQRFAGGDREAHVVDRVHRPATLPEQAAAHG